MAESTESVRVDKGKRQIEERETMDWGGKAVILPRGSTLPPSGIAGQVYVLTKAAGTDQLYIYDESVNNWVTVGP